METTGNLKSINLLNEENECTLKNFSHEDSILLGELALEIIKRKKLNCAMEVRLGEFVVFHISFVGTSKENDWWMNRKANVVKLKGHSSLYERVLSEEKDEDWFRVNNVEEENFAIHGGGFPIKLENGQLAGTLLISGLPQIDDHNLAVEILKKFKELK